MTKIEYKNYLIVEAKKIFKGTNFRIENEKKTYTDEKGFTMEHSFTAVVFDDDQGNRRYCGVDFI